MFSVIEQDDDIIIEIKNRGNDNINLSTIYTSSYFSQFGIDANVGIKSTHRKNHGSRKYNGGYIQSIDELTTPFKYVVYSIEKNPISKGIGLFGTSDDTKSNAGPESAPEPEPEPESEPEPEPEPESESEPASIVVASSQHKNMYGERNSNNNRDINEINLKLSLEENEAKKGFPKCPRLIDSIDIKKLAKYLRHEPVKKLKRKKGFEAIFILANDNVSYITRAIQEDQILATRFTVKRNNKIVELPSFWDVWEKNPKLSRKILRSSDPHEAKWEFRKEFGYNMATTFMPSYAKSIYEHFNAKRVLDPCAGWGDRMIGAEAAKCVNTYVGFDPNRTLRPGYVKLMQTMGESVTEIDYSRLSFSNNFTINTQPFEVGAKELTSESFDLVFTSPPFFNYEMYSPTNPKYSNWIDEFYKPLFIEASRCVVEGGHVAIHIGDTSVGAIESFLKTEVSKLCPLKLIYKLGLKGVMSAEIRTVWVFRKMSETSLLSAFSATSSSDDDTEIDGYNTNQLENDIHPGDDPIDEILVIQIKKVFNNSSDELNGKSMKQILNNIKREDRIQHIDEFETGLEYSMAENAILSLYAQLMLIRNEHNLSFKSVDITRMIYINGTFILFESGNFKDINTTPDINEILRPIIVDVTGFYPEALVGTKIARLQ